jgi:phage terminase Nu1 subunit (DNA packaging protein)
MSVSNSEYELTKAGVAYALGCDARTVSRYQDSDEHPLPVKERRRTRAGNRYDLRQITAWAVQEALRKIGIGKDGTVYDYNIERARLTKAQADKTELEVAELRGELISTPKALIQVESMVGAMRAKLLSLPTKVAAKIATTPVDMGKAQEAIRIEIYEALDEIASDRFQDQIQERIDRAAENAIGGLPVTYSRPNMTGGAS